MKTYEKYKNSGVEWIDEIPASWQLKKLKYLVRSVDEPPAVAADVIAVEDIESGTGKLFGEVAEKSYEGAVKGYREGDVLFNKLRPYLAKVYFAEECGAFCGELLNLRTKGELSGKFLYYRILSAEFIKIVDSSTNGIKLPRANWREFISHLRIPYPDLASQQTIARHLDERTERIEKIIEKKKRLIELLREERRSIITQAVTRGLDSNAKLKPSGIPWLGDIPQDWETRRLKYLVSVKARLGWRGLKADEYVPEGYGFLSTPNIKTDDIDFESINYITEERFLESPEIILEEGDVLLAKDGSTLGTVNVIRQLPFPSTVNSSIAILRVVRKRKLDPMYLKTFIGAEFIQNTIKMIKDGMGVPHLFQADIREFPLLIPPIPQQHLIVKYLTSKCGEIDAAIRKIEKEIGLIKEYRTSLISEVVTGKVKVV